MRGYLDFDVEMENVGVFWSGTEALLLEYRLELGRMEGPLPLLSFPELLKILRYLHKLPSSQEQLRLREKQKMLKNDWERFAVLQHYIMSCHDGWCLPPFSTLCGDHTSAILHDVQMQ